MDDRIKRALGLIEEWHNNQNSSGHNDINTLYELKEILSENPKEIPQDSLRNTLKENFEKRDSETTGRDQTILLENVAILSADFHTDKEYARFYQRFGPDLGGFPGIYRLVIDMARTMTKWEVEHGGGGEAFDISGLSWPEASEKFVNAVISRSLKDESPCSSFEMADIFEGVMGEEFEGPSPH